MLKIMLLAGALGILICILSCGPYGHVQSLPEEGIVDMHCHVAGIGEGPGESGCFISDEFRKNFRYKSYLKAFGVTKEELKKQGDDLVVDRLAELLRGSKFVKKAVVLAMDGVYGSDGLLDKERTQVYVPNEFVVKAVARHDNLLFGASVNPYRKDALERLDWAKEHGAVLVKWNPSVMNIDPSDHRIKPFYDKLVKLELPLLTHAGKESSFPHANQKLSDPEKLSLPLDMKVKVIAAHIASTGTYDGEKSHVRLFRMMGKYQNLYADISALTQLNRLHHMGRALTQPEFFKRFYYGSDFPLINSHIPLINIPLVSPLYQWPRLTLSEIESISKEQNPWDRDVMIKQFLGTPPHVFTKSKEFDRAKTQ